MKIEITQDQPVFKPVELKILLESQDEVNALYSLCQYTTLKEVSEKIEASAIISAQRKQKLSKSVIQKYSNVMFKISELLEDKIPYE